ncbi:MAG TPA: type II toxin-antitoxin system death-on-curing family toxin [Candidatus Eisenbacteria bacterium]|nr:type II toxin-antitoxin system death-on-curing family toxin [Candidatus Eisenbacteria bacterium]
MKRQPKWISRQAVLAFHERLLAEHGGASGILDEGLLDAALESPRNHFTYQRVDVPHLAAVYAYAITQNHPFVDGNKRVALTVAGVFLELNGFRLEASEEDAVGAMLALSSGRMNVDQFAEWLRGSCSAMRRRRVPKKK